MMLYDQRPPYISKTVYRAGEYESGKLKNGLVIANSDLLTSTYRVVDFDRTEKLCDDVVEYATYLNHK